MLILISGQPNSAVYWHIFVFSFMTIAYKSFPKQIAKSFHAAYNDLIKLKGIDNECISKPFSYAK